MWTEVAKQSCNASKIDLLEEVKEILFSESECLSDECISGRWIYYNNVTGSIDELIDEIKKDSENPYA